MHGTSFEFSWWSPLTSPLRAMLHDPETYTDPDSFKPERFITKDGRLSDDELVNIAFGFGRRSMVHVTGQFKGC